MSDSSLFYNHSPSFDRFSVLTGVKRNFEKKLLIMKDKPSETLDLHMKLLT